MWPQCGARTAKSHLAGTWGYRKHEQDNRRVAAPLFRV
jgi:hypothetical protein